MATTPESSTDPDPIVLDDDPRGRPSDDECYRILASRDTRFDGRFFFGVTSTGIYCRPICPAPTPRRHNVRVFACAAAAATAGFRPCLRCRPEASPGTPAWAGTRSSVTRALRLIDAGALDGGSVEELASRLGLGERHLRRLFDQHLGVSPVAVAQTRRVHFAKRLLDETGWPMPEVALAAGFSSLRRFNAAIRETYQRTPGELRGRRGGRRAETGDRASGGLRLRIAYRNPFDFQSMLDHLRPRAIPGVECVDGEIYRRSVRIEGDAAVIEVRNSPVHSAVELSVPASGARPIVDLVARTRRLFDLTADPGAVASALGDDPIIGPALAEHPGLRVAGAFDGFELAVRVILGQQVSVAGASTLAGRLVVACGVPLAEPRDDITHSFPTPEALAGADLSRAGLTATRAGALHALARAVAGGELALDGTAPPAEIRERLLALPGVGPWTVEMIAMRALRDPDAFPSGDLGLRRAAVAIRGGGSDPEDELPAAGWLVERARDWQPWRAYAAQALWTRDVHR